tara:strand:+ start:59991 stop:60467 length:477 start_codon:yes stop_codon:yes gene_type:complete
MRLNKGHKIVLVSVFILILDQITKFFVRKYLEVGDSIGLIQNIIHFTFVSNKGSAFGLFRDTVWINLILIITTVLVVGFLIYYLIKVNKEKGKELQNKVYLIAIGLIFGGAIGNLIDRLWIGYVVDFIDLRIWPVFNISDMAISLGIIYLVIYYIREK